MYRENRIGSLILLTLVVFFCVPFASQAQTTAREPFKIGETLTYKAEYNRAILRGIDVADLTFKIVKSIDSDKNDSKILFQGEAQSKGTLLKLFRFNFLQKIDSTVETSDEFKILRTVRHDKQDKRIRDGEAVFDYKKNRVTYRETDPNNPQSAPRMITSPLEDSVQDLLSAIYFLRRQPLTVGKTFEISISESGVVYQIPIKVVSKEKQNSIYGKIWTIRVEPEIFGDKRLIQGEGKMILWLTDDARRLPVRSQIQAKIGKVEIKLRSAAGLQPAK